MLASVYDVAAWAYCRWLDSREAHAGSVRPVQVRLCIEPCESEEGAISAVAHVDFENCGRHAVKMSGQTQILVNGKRPFNRIGYPTTNFFNVIAPARGIATLEVVGDRLPKPTATRVECVLLYDFEYEISEKRAHTSQKVGGKITFHGELDVQVVGPADIEFEIGPDVYDQYR